MPASRSCSWRRPRTPSTRWPTRARGAASPCLSTMVPWQTWFFGRKGNPNAPFGSTFHFFWGIEDLAVTYLDMWDAVRTDRTVGLLRPSAGPGFAAAVRRAGYRFVDAGDAQIVTGDPTAAELAAFVAAGPLPPVVTVGSAPVSEPPAREHLHRGVVDARRPVHLVAEGLVGGGAGRRVPRRHRPALDAAARLRPRPLRGRARRPQAGRPAPPREHRRRDPGHRPADDRGPGVLAARPGRQRREDASWPARQWRRGDDGWDLELVANKAAPDIPTTSTMERIG